VVDVGTHVKAALGGQHNVIALAFIFFKPAADNFFSQSVQDLIDSVLPNLNKGMSAPQEAEAALATLDALMADGDYALTQAYRKARHTLLKAAGKHAEAKAEAFRLEILRDYKLH
jgi:predicted RNA polymerase sigma factor